MVNLDPQRLQQAFNGAVADFDGATAALHHLGMSMLDIARVFDAIVSRNSVTWWGQRFPHEHPVDWIERVGIKVSGHNITPGEYWRFCELRDWWAGDGVQDEYGMDYQHGRDLWDGE